MIDSKFTKTDHENEYSKNLEEKFENITELDLSKENSDNILSLQKNEEKKNEEKTNEHALDILSNSETEKR